MNCEEFEHMQIAKCAEYVGTMIGPEGHAHRWTTPRKRFIQRIQKKLTPPPKAWLRDCAT